MTEALELKVISPEQEFYAGMADLVEFSTTEGALGIYKGHIPLTAAVVPGELRIHRDGRVKTARLDSGFVEILPEQVLILTAAAGWQEDDGSE